MISSDARMHGSRLMVWLSALLLLLVAAGAGLLWLQSERAQQALQREMLQRTELRAQQLSDLLAAQTQALLGGIDVALLQLRREWQESPDRFDAVARDLVAALPDGSVSHVTVVDATGMPVYNNLGSTDRVSMADRKHFQAHLTGGDRLVVGRAVQSRLAGGSWTFAVNRSLRSQGRFAGTMNILVPTAYFARQLASPALGERDIVGVIHADGSFIARSRDHEQAMGRSLPADRPFMRDPSAPGGLFRAVGEVDGVARIYAWKRLAGTQLVVSVGLAEADALMPLAAGRERERLLFGTLLAVVLAAMAAVLALLWQGSRRQQALERSERRYRALIDTSPDAIFLVRDGYFAYVNPATLALFGASQPEQLIGRPVTERIHPDLHAQVLARREHLQRELQPVPALEERYIRMDGSEVEVEVMAAPFVDEQGVSSQVIVRDITERRRTAHALQQLAADLEQRVKDRTAELEQARDTAERASRAKSEFLSRMSHELRTPLNAILGFGQLLEMQLAQPGPRGQVRQILDAGRHLLTLINDVLDLARIEAGHMAMSSEVVGLQPLVADCLALLRPQAQARRLLLSAPAAGDPRQVLADRTRLKQVLLNLLSNAVKYTPPGGSVQLRFEDRQDCWRICVDDTGPGLDEQQQQRLFVPFERLDVAASAVEGTGIGLALSRRLVELMGGRIGVHSQPQLGSSFWVDLPKAADLAPPEATALPPPLPAGPTAAVGIAQRELLYIEDNPVNLLLVQHVLALRPQWQLLAASTPSQGLELARTRRPRLVLLDIHLPEMDGWSVMRVLREDPTTRDIPVVAVSAQAMPSDLERGRAAGFADYLTKPLDLKRMLALLDAQPD